MTEQNPRELIARLRAAVAGQFVTFVDLSEGMVSLAMSGEYSRDVLAKGCTLDLHRDRFLAGDCAQTNLAKASMLIALPQAGSRFDIIVRRSFAEYIALWLRHAGSEYGFRFAMPADPSNTG